MNTDVLRSARCQQPVVKVWLHSTSDASPPAALLLLQILPVLPPHRANHARRGPRFSVVAPCPRGGAPNAAAALGTPGRLARLGATPDFYHGLLRRRDRSEPEIGLAAAA